MADKQPVDKRKMTLAPTNSTGGARGAGAGTLQVNAYLKDDEFLNLLKAQAADEGHTKGMFNKLGNFFAAKEEKVVQPMVVLSARNIEKILEKGDNTVKTMTYFSSQRNKDELEVLQNRTTLAKAEGHKRDDEIAKFLESDVVNRYLPMNDSGYLTNIVNLEENSMLCFVSHKWGKSVKKELANEEEAKTLMETLLEYSKHVKANGYEEGEVYFWMDYWGVNQAAQDIGPWLRSIAFYVFVATDLLVLIDTKNDSVEYDVAKENPHSWYNSTWCRLELMLHVMGNQSPAVFVPSEFRKNDCTHRSSSVAVRNPLKGTCRAHDKIHLERVINTLFEIQGESGYGGEKLEKSEEPVVECELLGF